MATKKDLVPSFAFVFSGEDRDLVYTIDTTEDISAWSFSWDAGGGTVTKTSGAGIVTTDAAAKQVTVTLAAADTAALEGAKVQYRFRRTDSGSNTVLAYGFIQVLSASEHA